jgi:tetratricopeptide (TPR) repeat protein
MAVSFDLSSIGKRCCHQFLILVTAILALASPAPAGERRIALVIGNGTYSATPLPNPVNDATDMAAALRHLGFSVSLKTNAGLQTMEDAVREFGAGLKQGGVGLFFYAGHGVQIAGRNYLIPIGARITKETDVKYQAVDAEMVLDEMAGSGSDMNIAILDACRDNPFGTGFRSATRGLAIVSAAPKGSLIAYSTSPGKVAVDGAGRNSPYTAALLKYMDQPGLSLLDVFMNVRQELVRRTRGQQVPWELSSLEGHFYFKEADAAGGEKAAPATAAMPKAVGAEDKPAARDWLDKGQRLAEAKGYSGAIACYDKAIALDPESASALAARAASRMMLGDCKGAQGDCDLAIGIDPAFALAYVYRGWAKGGLNDFGNAIKDCDTAIALDATLALAHYMRGWAKCGSGDYPGSIRDLDQALKLDPRMAWAYTHRATPKLMLGDVKGALEDCDRAIGIDPSLAYAYVNRGWAKGCQNDFGAAIQDCDKAVQLDPRLAMGYYMRGWAEAGMKQHAAAITDLDKAIELAPSLGYAYYFRGVSRAALGDAAAADKDYLAAARLGCADAQRLLTGKQRTQ